MVHVMFSRVSVYLYGCVSISTHCVVGYSAVCDALCAVVHSSALCAMLLWHLWLLTLSISLSLVSLRPLRPYSAQTPSVCFVRYFWVFMRPALFLLCALHRLVPSELHSVFSLSLARLVRSATLSMIPPSLSFLVVC